MATRKSTKAKTKTAKSKTTKSRSASSSRVTSRTTAPSRTNRSTNLINLLQLRRLLSLSVGLYVLLAAAAGFIMNSTTYQVTVGYLAKDELASRVNTIFAPAIRVFYNVEIRWALVVLLVLSAITPLLYLTRLEKSYAKALKNRVLSWRWIDLAVTTALMTEIVALMSGAQDIMTLKLVGGLMAITAVLGWLGEKQNENTSVPVWSAYITGLFSGLLPWLLIGVYAIGTPLYGMVRSPWYVYALYGVMVTSFILLIVNQSKQHRALGKWKNYLLVERNYLLISLVTKVAFAAILILGLRSL